MAWITRKKVCPSCGGDDFYRYHRKLWMRFFSGSQRMRCRVCRTTILLLRDQRSSADTADTPDQA